MSLKKMDLVTRIALFIISLHLSASAQTIRNEYPEIGRKCPDFTLNPVKYFGKKKVGLNDLKGKWAILEFWSKGCKASVASFPKMNGLQIEFKDEIQFLLIGKNDRKYNKGIQALYEKFRAKQDLKLPIAYDTILFERFGIESVPHVIILDKDGIVRAIMGAGDINSDLLRALLENKNPFIRKKDNIFEEPPKSSLDVTKPLLSENNGGPDSNFLFRSLLMNWDPKTGQRVYNTTEPQLEPRMLQVTGMPLVWLYSLAYLNDFNWHFNSPLYGKYRKVPVLEMADSSYFQYDYVTGKGVYNYSLIYSGEAPNESGFHAVLKRDLQNYFGFEVSVETRNLPCWKLKVLNRKVEKLKSKKPIGEPWGYQGDDSGFRMTNIPIGYILSTIHGYHQSEPPFIDDTGISTNIDITLDAILTDIQDIRKALQVNGLDLVKDFSPMKVLVIRDKKRM